VLLHRERLRILRWAHEVFPHAFFSSLLFSSLLYPPFLGGWVALVCAFLVPSASAQTEEPSASDVESQSLHPIGGLEFQHEEFLKLQSELDAVFQGYYTAVEQEHFDWALAYYAWEPLKKAKKEEQEAARQNALDAAQLVKQQIVQNGGIRGLTVHGVFQRSGLVAVVEVEFNNGMRDLSPAVAIIYEGERLHGEWKLEVVTVSMKIPPPLVGQREILASFETIYRAALEVDFAQMRELSYEEGLFLSLKEKKPEEREKRIARIYEVAAKRIQTAVHVNGGLVSVDIPLMQESTVYVYTKPGEEPIAIASATIRRKFENGKEEAWQTSFFLDRDGRWRANPNTLR